MKIGFMHISRVPGLGNLPENKKDRWQGNAEKMRIHSGTWGIHYTGKVRGVPDNY
jgi:hypothetical protein